MGTKRVVRMEKVKEKLEEAGYDVKYSLTMNLEIRNRNYSVETKSVALEIEKLLDFPYPDIRWVGYSIFLYFYD